MLRLIATSIEFFLSRQINNNKNYIIILLERFFFWHQTVYYSLFAALLLWLLLLFIVLFHLKSGIKYNNVVCLVHRYNASLKWKNNQTMKRTKATNGHRRPGREREKKEWCKKRVMDSAQAYSLRKLTVKYMYCVYVYVHVIWFARVRQCYLAFYLCCQNRTRLSAQKSESPRS